MRPETYYSIGTNLTAGSSNTLFTVPSGYEARVSMVYIANNGNQNRDFSALWNHRGTDVQFAAGRNLNNSEYVQFGGDFGGFLVMDEGDYIAVTPESGSNFVSIVSLILLKHDGVKFDLTV